VKITKKEITKEEEITAVRKEDEKKPLYYLPTRPCYPKIKAQKHGDVHYLVKDGEVVEIEQEE